VLKCLKPPRVGGGHHQGDVQPLSNLGAIIILIFVLAAIFAPLLALEPDEQHLSLRCNLRQVNFAWVLTIWEER
jgi:hypothetical protein